MSLVVSIIGNRDASTEWRTVQPAEMLARQGHGVTYVHKDDDKLFIPAMLAEVLVLSRLTWDAGQLDQAREWLGKLREAGKFLVFECDDDMFLHLGEHLTASEDQAQRERAMLAIHTVRLCDAVTVSTQRLATTLRHVAPEKPVACVPNFIDLDRFDGVRSGARRIHRDTVTIGWAGAKRQEDDVAPLCEAWARIAAEHKRVRFVVAGWVPDNLRASVPAHRLTVLPWLPYARYAEHYRQIDIGCCAVADTPFNRCKSNIKAQEFGAASAAVVASPCLYRDIVKDGDTGYLAETADEWYEALSLLVSSGAMRRTLGRRLRRRVETEWALERHAARWLGAWQWLREAAQGRQAA